MQTFFETGLKPEILKSIEKMGFTKPTAIQSQTIPFILESTNDLIAMAQTGTGKTAAFGLPILNKIDLSAKQVQTIILCPTRELCLQITKDLKTYAEFLPISIVPVYGGAPIYEQISAIRNKCHIVVGTPGRVNDLIKRDKLDLSSVSFLVLDEADEMLKMGFRDEMDAILSQTPETKQTFLFSATMPPDISRMAGKYMHKPEKISVGRENTSHENISHEYCVTKPEHCYRALRRIADINTDIYSIVFCRTRMETKDIADKLIADGYNADSLHGDLSQAQRDQVMNRFRNKSLQILVATDVAARGLDVDNLTHVIHFHLPDDQENYIHRSGRTGRAGRKGASIAIITPGETRKLYFLEKNTSQKFIKLAIPSGTEVFEKRLSTFLETVAATEPKGFDLGKYTELIESSFKDMTKEEAIKKFLAIEFNRFKVDFHQAPDLNISTNVPSQSQSQYGGGGGMRKGFSAGAVQRDKFSRYSINLGAKNNMKPDLLINIINRQTPDRKIAIGRIEIQQKISFFEADSEHEKHLIQAFRRAKYKGLPLMIQPFQKK
jgi:ATP-dependent RNA helicase DeaD